MGCCNYILIILMVLELGRGSGGAKCKRKIKSENAFELIEPKFIEKEEGFFDLASIMVQFPEDLSQILFCFTKEMTLILEYQIEGSKEWLREEISDLPNWEFKTIRIRRVRPCSKYNFRLLTKVGNKVKAKAVPLRSFDTGPNKVSKIKLVEGFSTNLTISWSSDDDEDGDCSKTTYIVKSELSGETWETRSKNFTFSDLRPCTNYTYSIHGTVKAENGSTIIYGPGKFISYTTLPDAKIVEAKIEGNNRLTWKYSLLKCGPNFSTAQYFIQIEDREYSKDPEFFLPRIVSLSALSLEEAFGSNLMLSLEPCQSYEMHLDIAVTEFFSRTVERSRVLSTTIFTDPEKKLSFTNDTCRGFVRSTQIPIRVPRQDEKITVDPLWLIENSILKLDDDTTTPRGEEEEELIEDGITPSAILSDEPSHHPGEDKRTTTVSGKFENVARSAILSEEDRMSVAQIIEIREKRDGDFGYIGLVIGSTILTIAVVTVLAIVIIRRRQSPMGSPVKAPEWDSNNVIVLSALEEPPLPESQKLTQK